TSSNTTRSPNCWERSARRWRRPESKGGTGTMIRIFDFDKVAPEEILNRDIRAEADVEAVVDGIIADVRRRGDEALRDYARRFDHAELDSLLVSREELEEAFAAVGEEFLTTLRMAADNIRHFHEQQVHRDFMVNDTPGVVL